MWLYWEGVVWVEFQSMPKQISPTRSHIRANSGLKGYANMLFLCVFGCLSPRRMPSSLYQWPLGPTEPNLECLTMNHEKEKVIDSLTKLYSTFDHA